MAWTTLNFTAFQTLTATQMNQLVANTAGLKDGTLIDSSAITTAKIADAAVTNAKLSTTAGEVGGAATTFTPSPLGFTGAVTTTVASYLRVGKLVYVNLEFTGTSNATTCTFTLPIAPKNADRWVGVRVTDAGVNQTTNGVLILTASSTTATVGKNVAAAGAFTNSGVKTIQIYGFVYEGV